MANRAADDLGGLMHILSKSWFSLADNKKAAFQLHLREQHHLFITEEDIPITDIVVSYPFIPRLEKALHHHTGQSISIKQGVDGELCFWVVIPQAEQQVKIGFLHSRLGPHPSKAIAGILTAGCLLILITTLLLVRRITQPITTLSKAVNLLSSGKLTTQVPETGAKELVMLARSFNQMTREITQLISNRSILFGGISHDLRTPITRMQIALELIEDCNDSSLISGMRNDLNEMESLIKQALELIKGMDKHHAINVKINNVIDEIVSNYQRQGHIIHWKNQECDSCIIEVNALRRVLCNLLDNAFRYSEQKPVKLSCKKAKNKLIIKLLDQGSGIPADKLEAVLQPFYRLDNSRNKKIGGSGLGLAIVQQLCDIHHWKIKLLPIEQGGLEVRLEIPVITNYCKDNTSNSND
ncbi:MAG: HAMP domain-containing protein [Methylococcales bacterium]|nr:HAMP domain-containing protein [Methylococcales bacterium]